MNQGRQISAPERLREDHDLAPFDCGVPVLDDWLKKRAWSNESSGASRTYVVCEDTRVIGYYALATGAVTAQGATGRVRRNMPDPIPVMVIGRLAADRDFQGQGLGIALLRDAVVRTRQAASIAGIRAILIHAISEEAKRFYLTFGFRESPIDPMTLMLPMSDVERLLG